MSTAVAPPDADHLPDDPALLKAMLAELLAALRHRDRELEQVRHRLDQVLRRLYGPRAERFDPSQPLLFAELATAAATPAPPAPQSDAETPCRKRSGHGRQQLPKHLPRDRRVYELSAVERSCPCCGQARQVIGQEVSEQLDYVPASLRVIEHVRLTYACPGCAGANPVIAGPTEGMTAPDADAVAADTGCPSATETAAEVHATAQPPRIVTAPKPAVPIPRGLPAPGLLAYLIVSKFGDHLPLYRLEHIFARQGVNLKRSTLCDWLLATAEVLRPLYRVLVDEVFQSWVVQTDDTPVSVQEPGRGKVRQGHVWDYWGDAYHPYVVYDYTPNHAHTGPQEFLQNYRGYLQADAYAGYDALYAKAPVYEVGCWAHARRKFFEAQSTDPEPALYALTIIRQLYQVERQADEAIEARQLALPDGWWLRLRLRHEQALPLLNTFGTWLEQQRELVLPKAPIAEAVGYACNHWAALRRYLTQGYLAIDNNAAERALRTVAVGRKNYLFFGSDGGGRTAAVLYSFVQSCKRLGIEPWRYLRGVLEVLPSWPAARLPELLPDRWAQVQATQVRTTSVSG